MATHTFKYRIYPTAEQAEKLSRFFGCARKMYNLSLAWWRDAYMVYKETGEPMGKVPDYGHYRKMPEYSYFSECDTVALQQARIHFEKAIKAYLESKDGKRKGKVGFPKFKKKGVSKDAYTTYNNGTAVHITSDGKHITLPKIGKVKIVLHRPFCGKVKTVNVSRTKSGRYFVSITVETREKEGPVISRVANADNPKVVGLDMSMSSFAVSSDSADVAKPKYVRLFRKNQRRLARLSRRVSRKQMVEADGHKRGSRNREKARRRYARACERVADQRRDFVAKAALHFARRYDVVVLEDINLQAMSQSLKLGKSVMDLGFGEFRRWLEWEGSKYDCYIHYADRWFASSQTCSECGHVNKGTKDLKVREWVCPVCGAVHDRDVNAATNLKNSFLEEYSTAGTAGIHACGDSASTLRETVARVLAMKQEARGCRGSSEARDFSRG